MSPAPFLYEGKDIVEFPQFEKLSDPFLMILPVKITGTTETFYYGTERAHRDKLFLTDHFLWINERTCIRNTDLLSSSELIEIAEPAWPSTVLRLQRVAISKDLLPLMERGAREQRMRRYYDLPESIKEICKWKS